MFKKFIDKRIENRLKKEGFTKVPTAWVGELEDVGNRFEESSATLRIVANEYNALLVDFVKFAPITILKEGLKVTGVEKIPRDKVELSNLYVDTFKIVFDDDSIEVITDDKPFSESKVQEEQKVEEPVEEKVAVKKQTKTAKAKPKTTKKK